MCYAEDAAYQTNENYDYYVSCMVEANSFYKSAVSAEGKLKKKLLQDALNVLELVPDDFPASPQGSYKSKQELVRYITSMM